LSNRSGCLGLYGLFTWGLKLHPFDETEKIIFPFAVCLATFIVAYLMALIPCSFKKPLRKIFVYAFYLANAIMAAIFIISLPLHIDMSLCGMGEFIALLCLLSTGVFPFVLILLSVWAAIMLSWLLRDRKTR